MTAAKVWKTGARLPDLLDWILAVLERLLALGMGVVVLWAGYRLASGMATQNEKDTIFKLGENWKAVLFDEPNWLF